MSWVPLRITACAWSALRDGESAQASHNTALYHTETVFGDTNFKYLQGALIIDVMGSITNYCVWPALLNVMEKVHEAHTLCHTLGRLW